MSKIREKIKTILILSIIGLSVISFSLEKAEAALDARVLSAYKKESPPFDNRWNHYDKAYTTIYFQKGYTSRETQTDIRSLVDKGLGISRYQVYVHYSTY